MMKKFTHNCNDIKRHSKKDTYNIFIRYKTPILEGAIKIINEFSKYKNDGIHYKNLCEELLKYFKVQKRCVREEVTSQGHKFKTYEWNKIVDALYTTFNSQKVKRLCYLEKDNDEDKKKYVLNIHEEFRNFCIEKKQKETNSNLTFEECMEYLEWIKKKKEIFQGLDPGYAYISDYRQYFNIRDKCNYPWLVNNVPDVICTQLTRTRGSKKEDPDTTSGDTHQITPGVTQDHNPNEKKDTPPAAQHPGKADEGPVKVKTSYTGPENTPAQSTPSGDDNVNNVHKNYDVKLQGTTIDEPNPVPKSPDKQTFPEYSDPKVQEFIIHNQNNVYGQEITHDTRHAINRMSDTIYKYNPSDVHGEAITPPKTKPYKFIPLNVLYSQKFVQLLRSQRFVELLRLQPFRNLLFSKRFLSNLLSKERFIPPTIHSQQVPPAIPHTEFYVPKHKPIKTQVNFIPAELIFYPNITTDNKIKDIVKVEKGPAIPNPSHFRFPFMIYTLVFLTISTAITILYLLSK
ncbi:STP1 protein, partial [Plasmodium ovale]